MANPHCKLSPLTFQWRGSTHGKTGKGLERAALAFLPSFVPVATRAILQASSLLPLRGPSSAAWAQRRRPGA